MKTRSAFVLLVMFFASFHVAFAGVVTHEYTFDQPRVTTAQDAQLIVMEGCRTGGVPGSPALPSYGVKLLLTPGEGIQSVRVIPEERQLLGFRPSGAQEEVIDQDDDTRLKGSDEHAEVAPVEDEVEEVLGKSSPPSLLFPAPGKEPLEHKTADADHQEPEKVPSRVVDKLEHEFVISGILIVFQLVLAKG